MSEREIVIDQTKIARIYIGKVLRLELETSEVVALRKYIEQLYPLWKQSSVSEDSSVHFLLWEEGMRQFLLDRYALTGEEEELAWLQMIREQCIEIKGFDKFAEYMRKRQADQFYPFSNGDVRQI